MALHDTILQKSHELFYKQGFHDTGVELLAKQAGTTKRTLYAHFGNKEGLIEAVLNYRHQTFMMQLQDTFECCGVNKTATAVAMCYFDFLKRWTSAPDFHGCMFINACAEYADIQSSPHKIAAQHKAEVRQWLLDNFVQVEADTDHAKQLSDMLFVLGEGMIVAAQTGQEVPDLDHKLLAFFN